MIRLPKKFAKIKGLDETLGLILGDLQLRLGLAYRHEHIIRISLSNYGGSVDIVYINPAAMKMLNPKDPENIHLSDMLNFEKIHDKFRRQISALRTKQLNQAISRTLEILNHLMKSHGELYIIIQGTAWDFRRNLMSFLNYLKGKKVHSAFLPLGPIYKDEYGDDECYYRIIFKHNFDKLRLKPLLKRKIYVNYTELYFAIPLEDTFVIVNIYDDRGMDIMAPPNVLNELEEKFRDWVKEKES